jgi:MFS family permease
VPAIVLMRWLGLKGTFVVSLIGYNVASGLRLWDANPFEVYGFAFLAGFFLAILSVGIAVTISRLTTSGNRQLGFTLFFIATIVSGFFGDAIGGELPGILERIEHGHGHGDRLLASLFIACALGLSAVIPALFMRLAGEAHPPRVRLPHGPAVRRLITAIAFWGFAVGLFAPFFGVYFSSHLGASVRTIGLDLASGQIVGALFTAFAPMWVGAWGPVRSIRFFMFAAGASAFFMTLTEATLVSGVGYAIYMGYLAMVQPPLNTLLMNAVTPEEQAGASMINSLFGFSAVALGGFIGGQLIDALGYPQMLALAGAGCMAAAVVFVLLVPPDEPTARLRFARGLT